MTAPGCHAARVTPRNWEKMRADVRIDLLLYALGWTLQRWYLRLRAVSRRPDTRPAPRAVPEAGPSPVRPPGPAGTGPCDPVPGPVPPDVTRDDLVVIHAGGMLLEDRPREDPDPGPFTIRPYYLKHEREQAGWGWLP